MASEEKAAQTPSNGTLGTATPYYDTLPLFQMYQLILRRHLQNINHQMAETPPDDLNTNPLDQDNHLIADEPPEYRDAPPQANARVTFTTTDISNQPLSPQLAPMATPQPARLTFDLVVDNVDGLKRVLQLPIHIQVVVTRDIPNPTEPSTQTPALPYREYTCDDFVHGYVLVHNTSDRPLPFEMFTVLLEGTEIVTLSLRPVKHLRKFLRMFDLAACWLYDTIANSVDIEFEHFSTDPMDRLVFLGLPDNRMLKPHTKYKKFFTFRFPHRLLDTACAHPGQPEHLKLPSTVGVDRLLAQRDFGIAEVPQVDPATGYSLVGVAGAPVVVNDMLHGDLTIQYTVEARFISKKHKDGDMAIEDLLEYHQMYRHFVVSGAATYHLRFVGMREEDDGFIHPPLAKAQLLLLETNAERMLARLAARAERTKAKELSSVDAAKEAQLYTTKLTPGNIFSVLSQDGVLTPVHSTPVGQLSEDQKVDQFYSLYYGAANDTIVGVVPYEMKKVFGVRRGMVRLLFSPSENNARNSVPVVPVVPYVLPLQGLELPTTRVYLLYAAMMERFANYGFSLTVGYLGSKPPKVVLFEAKLVGMTIKSEGLIPLAMGAELFTGGEEAVERMKSKFGKWLKQLQEYVKKDAAAALVVPEQLLLEVEAMSNLDYQTSMVLVFKVTNYSSSEWTKDGNGWSKQVGFRLTVKPGTKHTVPPGFQSCLMARVYCILFVVTLDNGGKVEVEVPIEVGQAPPVEPVEA